MTEIMRDETRCLGRFYFTSLLEYIRERQRSMKDISGLESIEKTVRQWQPFGASARLEQQLLLKEVRIGRRSQELPSWTGVVSEMADKTEANEVASTIRDESHTVELNLVFRCIIPMSKLSSECPLAGEHKSIVTPKTDHAMLWLTLMHSRSSAYPPPSHTISIWAHNCERGLGFRV
jgi:hypothetical protein